MRKIANTHELTNALERLLDYASSHRPSRAVLASELRDLSARVAAAVSPESMKNGKRFKADGDTMVAKKVVKPGWVVAENSNGGLVMCNYNANVKPPKWEGLEWFKAGDLDKAVSRTEKRSDEGPD